MSRSNIQEPESVPVVEEAVANGLAYLNDPQARRALFYAYNLKTTLRKERLEQVVTRLQEQVEPENGSTIGEFQEMLATLRTTSDLTRQFRWAMSPATKTDSKTAKECWMNLLQTSLSDNDLAIALTLLQTMIDELGHGEAHTMLSKADLPDTETSRVFRKRVYDTIRLDRLKIASIDAMLRISSEMDKGRALPANIQKIIRDWESAWPEVL